MTSVLSNEHNHKVKNGSDTQTKENDRPADEWKMSMQELIKAGCLINWDSPTIVPNKDKES